MGIRILVQAGAFRHIALSRLEILLNSRKHNDPKSERGLANLLSGVVLRYPRGTGYRRVYPEESPAAVKFCSALV